MRKIVFVLIVASLLFSAAAATLAAQELRGEMQSLGVERVSIDESDGISMITLRHTAIRTGRPGIDVGLGIVPYSEGAGFVFDAGVAWTIPGEIASPHLRVGGSLVMALIPGFYAGVGLTIPVARRIGIRFDATHRTYIVPGYGSGSVWSAGAGVALLTERKERRRD